MGALFNATRIQLQLVYFVYYLPIVKELLRNYEDASHSGNATLIK
uniref:Uncharacterized protein n=1 Tax=viral metagenome TaxID=1070528 RepID=A0A6M3LB03_9ZZZZ